MKLDSFFRRRAGILTGDILGTLDEFPPDRRKEAVKAIEDVENEVHHKLKHKGMPVKPVWALEPRKLLRYLKLDLRNVLAYLLPLLKALSLL